MLTFAVVVARGGGSIPRRVLERLQDRDNAQVPTDVGSHLVWSNASGSVCFAGWQDTDDDAVARQRWHVDAHGITAFKGHVWPRESGWPSSAPWAAQLAGHLERSPLVDATHDLAGWYVAASLRMRGGGTVAADPLGFGLVHWGHGPEVVAIGSRASLVADLLAADRGTSPVRDAAAVAWLAYGINAMGLSSGFVSVSVAPAGSVIEIDAERGTARARPGAARPWRADAGAATSVEDTIEASGAEMTTALRMALARSEGAPRVGLTGGRDSRLVLALAVQAGIAPDLEFATWGAPDLPDVVVASDLAATFGLRHVVNPGIGERWAWRQWLEGVVRRLGDPEASSREIQLRVTAWAGAGRRNVGEPLLGRAPSARVVVSGLCGEMLRTNYGSTIRYRTKRDAASFPDEVLFGSLRLFRPEVQRRARHELHELLFAGSVDSDSPQDVVDDFFIRERMRPVNSASLEIDSENRILPLYSLTALRLAFAIGAENRRAEWIHRELMRRACARLTEIPFGAGGWASPVHPVLVPPAVHREPPPPGPPPAPETVAYAAGGPLRTLVGERRAASRAVDREVMRRYLHFDSTNPLAELFDPRALDDALDRYEVLHERERLQLFGALTAAIWVGEQEIPVPRGLERVVGA